jgi:hypothetical protein
LGFDFYPAKSGANIKQDFKIAIPLQKILPAAAVLCGKGITTASRQPRK